MGKERRPGVLALVVAALISSLAACGTTVPASGQAAAGFDVGVRPPVSAGSPPGASGTTASGSNAEAPGEPLPTSTAPATGTSSPAAPADSGPGKGSGTSPGAGADPVAPGVTANSISVGLTYADQSDGNSFLGGFGVEGLEQGDVAAQARAVRAYINRNGGVAGRKLELVLHKFDFSASLAENAERSCATYTQDNKVFAGFTMLSESYPNDQLAACLERAGAITVTGSLVAGSDSAFFARYPDSYYAPGQLEAVTAARTYVNGLHAAGYFGGAPRIGLVYIEGPTFIDAYKRGIVPTLARHGMRVTSEAAIPMAQSASEAGNTSAAIQNAVLRFHSQRIDHVLFLDSGGGVAHFFMTTAANQQYAPRYGLNSDSNPAFLQQNQSTAQLRGAVAVGWTPSLDVDTSRLPSSAGSRLCDRIMNEAGLRPRSANDRWGMYKVCSGLLFLQASLDSAKDLSRGSFRTAAEGLGPVPSGAVAYRETYGPNKHWSAATYRLLSYQTACSCFTYSSADNPVASN